MFSELLKKLTSHVGTPFVMLRNAQWPFLRSCLVEREKYRSSVNLFSPAPAPPIESVVALPEAPSTATVIAAAAAAHSAGPACSQQHQVNPSLAATADTKRPTSINC
jgi:hypothetical protein